MRDPLISIKASELREVLQAEGLNYSDQKYFELLKRLKNRRCVNRTFVFTNTANARKISKNIRNVSNNVEKFNGMLKSIRVAKGHKAVRNITKDDKQYESVKAAAGICDDFIKTFNIEDISQGIDLFINIGLDIMGKKFAINKFNFYKDHIYQEFEARLVIREDNNTEGTKVILDTYKQGVLEVATVEYSLAQQSDALHFVYARMEADENKANYQEWVYAQFEGLAFLDAIPEPNQLYGIKALERYQRYRRKSNAYKINPAAVKPINDDTKAYIDSLRKKRFTE